MSETPEVSETPEEPGAPSVRAEGWLPAPAIELFGAGASAVEEYALLTVDVPAERWLAALLLVRDELGCDYFDWLSAVDEPGTGFLVCAHLVALPTAHTTTAERRTLRRLIVRTVVPHDAAELPTATEVYAGAAWHERETYEMFGVRFPGHPGLDPLLLPDGFEGHPLRKDFVLAARVAKAWPGAKEPGESHDGGPRRRQMLPPGVPDPNEWGPLKGQLPAAPARGRARGAERTAAAERPRRNRGASQGSASQVAADTQTTDTQTPASGTAPAARPARPRRSRSASEGSASQRATPRDDQPPAGQPTSAQGAGGDAPWHHARPAFEENADERDSTARPAVPEDAPTEAPTEDEQRGRTEDEG